MEETTEEMIEWCRNRFDATIESCAKQSWGKDYPQTLVSLVAMLYDGDTLTDDGVDLSDVLSRCIYTSDDEFGVFCFERADDEGLKLLHDKVLQVIIKTSDGERVYDKMKMYIDTVWVDMHDIQHLMFLPHLKKCEIEPYSKETDGIKVYVKK